MGLSLSVLVALALVLPGAAFVFGLSRMNSPSTPTTVLDQHVSIGLAITVVSSIVFHTVALSAIWGVSRLDPTVIPRVDVAQVFALLSGDIDSDWGKRALRSLDAYPVLIGGYFVALTATTWLLGKRLDKRLRTPKDASWYALLRPPGASFVVLTTDLMLDGKCVFFSGVVSEFFVNRNGELERVALLFCARKPIANASERSPQDDGDARSLGHGWTEIPGESVVLIMKDSRTVNLDYFYDDEDTPEGSSDPDDGNVEIQPT